MALPEDRQLRADAARNASRVLQAARTAYAEHGPDVHMSVVARLAGVGERTLYRHFPTKTHLLRATLEQMVDEELTPTIGLCRQNDDALQGLTDLLSAAIELNSRAYHLMDAARKTGALTGEIARPLYAALHELVSRAQQSGQIRPDLVPEDLPRVIAMLHSVLWTMEPDDDGWRRYLCLILDGLSAAGARSLPAAPPVRTTLPGLDTVDR